LDPPYSVADADFRSVIAFGWQVDTLVEIFAPAHEGHPRLEHELETLHLGPNESSDARIETMRLAA
jgi:hypothetical protein